MTTRPAPRPRTGRVAYQGEPGANSHLACEQMAEHLEPMACQTFEDAIGAVQDGAADLAVIPIDNSSAGRVADVHHLLPGSGLWLAGEHFLPIHFHLMALPGTTIADVRSVRSHAHAFGQCRTIIREHGWRGVVADDTAGAAREVAEGDDRTVGALSPLLAAELYGLEVLASDVEDEHHNTTRFVALSPEPVEVTRQEGTPYVTSFVFRVRNIPSALYKALGGFATNGVNMTKLESYQIGGVFAATQFYADVEGHPDDTGLGYALEELSFFTDELRMLGTYPASPWRSQLGAADPTDRPRPHAP
ncbi:prephenate dehydratase [uncultured Nocardioides sp.]|uniref:prephenate dehydratase n=1 Tax=uncultured Nocardioides sp. TaxID=198441 RepID=UPI00260F7B32|nr:prephenate dehydratase [uncultured Nocardioides sp.]